MKVLIVVDKQGTAIDRLAWMVKNHNPHLDIKIIPVHPKRNDADTLYKASNLMSWADVIDIHYWKSGEVLRTSFAKQFKEKPRILFHFNPYDAESKINKKYTKVVVGNSEIYNKIPYAHLVEYGVDLDFFKFNKDYTEEKIVNMSVSRIESKKGVLQVAQVCKELGYKFYLVGRVSNGPYMQEILDVGGVEFWENASDEELRNIYYKSAIHVCNSVDDFESGTLPILESMACGLPVLTRNVGHVPDLFNGKNMVVRKGEKDDLKDLKRNLKEMMENREWRLKLRENAWDNARRRNSKIMAHKVAKLYNSIYMPDRKLASVIIPTKDNPESFSECLVKALLQDYKKIEVIVSDSGDTPVKKIVDEAKKNTGIPIKYIHFEHHDEYTLAEARNRAVIEADGEVLVFCDDRIGMEPNAVTRFVTYLTDKTWVWGKKDGAVKGFVENFSAVMRADLIKYGMFNERMAWYGGMTQDIRTRFESELGFTFLLVDQAEAKGLKRTGGKQGRRESIINAKYLLHKMYDK